jgi:HK97 family phage major capsid protein
MTRKEEIEARKLEIREEVETTEDIEKVEELAKEVETLEEEERKIDEHIENEKAAKEMEEKSFAVKEVVKEEKEMENNKEFRNSKEYINAFAEYIKTNDDKELRALITTEGYATGNSATVEVPDMVYDIVKTAWEREELIQYVKTVSVKGNLKVQFEVSADGAVVHTEGNGAVSEESLVLGVVELPAKSIKKWISISDEVLDMRGEDFLRYIYDEITYRIAKKCADELVAIIKALPQTLSANESTGVYDKVSANKITTAPAIDTIAQAIANLSDEATNPIIVMNKLTFAAFKEAQYNGNYSIDPFEGLKVVFNNSLPAYSTASANGVYAIVGDFNEGALLNFPNGEGTEMKYDDKKVMEYDLVRILGRRYVGMNAVADKAFCLIAKPVSA